MNRTSSTQSGEVIARVIQALSELDPEELPRALRAIGSYFDQSSSGHPHRNSAIHSPVENVHAASGSFSVDRSPSAKAFLNEKQPRTDVERIACLAYYLTHYRDLPQFKTVDLTKLNTEAAQPKFSNASFASGNAVKTGYLAPGDKGRRQLSAAAEKFVEALPDRNLGRDIMSNARGSSRRRVRKMPPTSK
jgi:hypothetical protein